MDIGTVRLVTDVYTDLLGIARSLHRLDENSCNWGLSPSQEAREEKLVAMAEDLANKLGLHAYHQGDPRGCSLYIVDAETKSNDQYTNGVAVC